ncbi:hypothetical protein EDB82DRAFT_544376 [Fusarium venenatum]|uniref:uncharacterized protein n=1 Tax=Fusarium venenatum TaxID=56646 RepID=UPI001D2DEE8E|nr:hypothetical protein EDB82DRAFT_544376 [Fusarium venenatum]
MPEVQIWPLPSTQYDVRAVSAAESLERSHEKVFSNPNERFEIQVAEITSKEPAYGWSHLPITKSGAMKLFSALRAFPELYQYVTAFSDKTFPRDEGFAGFDSHTTIGDDGSWTVFESCYLLKYIDRRDIVRQCVNPWTIRHALIYQKFDRIDSRTSHLLARLPTAVSRLLGESIGNSGEKSVFVQDWSHLHTTCFSSINDNLRKFINYLDHEITDLFHRVIMAGVEPEKLNEFDTLQSTARDFKELQYLSDQTRRVISIVELNILTLECFQKKVQHLIPLSVPGSPQAATLERFFQQLSRCHTEHQFGLRNASSVFNRAKATSDQLRDTVSMRNGEFNKTSTEMTSRNTSAMCHLTNKSGREAHVLKTLTVLALVFVPAGFVAMGFVSLKQESPMQWSVTPDLKIYAILSIPLISLTMLIYAMVEIIQRLKERKLEANGHGIV